MRLALPLQPPGGPSRRDQAPEAQESRARRAAVRPHRRALQQRRLWLTGRSRGSHWGGDRELYRTNAAWPSPSPAPHAAYARAEASRRFNMLGRSAATSATRAGARTVHQARRRGLTEALAIELAPAGHQGHRHRAVFPYRFPRRPIAGREPADHRGLPRDIGRAGCN